MSEKRVFVTGSTGCIGAHAVSILLGEGCRVFGFNRKPPVERLDGYQHIGGDLSDKKSIESALQTAHPTHVLHLGALQTPDCRDYPIRGPRIWVIDFCQGIDFILCQKIISFLYEGGKLLVY